MRDDKEYYVVYRVYSYKERPDTKENAVVYGWTDNKRILKGFLQQRSERKYTVFVNTRDEIGRVFSHTDLPSESMINMIKLPSSKSDEKFPMFMTMSELQEVEKRIQRLFIDQSSISNIQFKSNDKEILYFLMLILNLKEEYSEALDYIGYRPPEVDSLFDSSDEYMSDTGYEDLDEHFDLPGNRMYRSNANDPSKLVLYSIESFIKVMKEDL